MCCATHRDQDKPPSRSLQSSEKSKWETVVASVTLPLITCTSLPIIPFYTCAIITWHTKKAGSVSKNPPGNMRDAGLIPGSGRSPGEGNGSPLQCSCPGNPMDRGAGGLQRVTRESYTPQQLNSNTQKEVETMTKNHIQLYK